MNLFHDFVDVWELLSVYVLEQLSGIVLASVEVDRSVCVDYTAKSVWDVLSRWPRWPPTFSLLLFLLLFPLSLFSSFSPLPQLLLWFKTNFRITMAPNIPRSKQVSATIMFVFKFYFIYIHRSKIFMFHITHYELGLPVGRHTSRSIFRSANTTNAYPASTKCAYRTQFHSCAFSSKSTGLLTNVTQQILWALYLPQYQRLQTILFSQP